MNTRLPGAHNVANSLAAIAVGDLLGIPRAEITDAVSSFTGATRRFELLGEVAGITVVDDYAHHPTEISANIQAARERFPGRRLVVLFQPHTYTRTTYLLDAFRGCFAAADAVYIADTYAAREEPSAGLGARALAAEVRDPPAVYAGSLADAARLIADFLQPGDVLMTLGAGDVDSAGRDVVAILQNRAPESYGNQVQSHG